MKRCYNGGNKHKFQARYEEIPRSASFKKFTGIAQDLQNLLHYKKYIYDICVWCGKTVTKIEKEE